MIMFCELYEIVRSIMILHYLLLFNCVNIIYFVVSVGVALSVSVQYFSECKNVYTAVWIYVSVYISAAVCIVQSEE